MELISLLNKFADDCRETTGGCFTLSKKKNGDWAIRFVNIYKKEFTGVFLPTVVNDAHEYLLLHRKPVEIETKYTLYS